MPTKQSAPTYRTPQSARQRVLAAREERRAETQAAEDEPMRRWIHPIPVRDAACPCSPCRTRNREETSAALTQALEKLQYQNQVLTDLLSAVNALTAAVLCLKNPGSQEE